MSSSRFKEKCIYCQEKIISNSRENENRNYSACIECEVLLRCVPVNQSFTLNVRFLIEQYRIRYNLLQDIKTAILLNDLNLADKVLKVKEIARGEERVRNLMGTYRYSKLMEEMLAESPEDQLSLKLPVKIVQKVIKKRKARVFNDE